MVVSVVKGYVGYLLGVVGQFDVYIVVEGVCVVIVVDVQYCVGMFVDVGDLVLCSYDFEMDVVWFVIDGFCSVDFVFVLDVLVWFW